MAHTRAWEMLTTDEQSREAEMKFDPIWSNGRRMYRLRERPRMVYEKFSGLTYHEYQDKLVEEIIRNEPPEIFELFTTDSSYCYGTGLHIVIHADEINRQTIERAIRRFREEGEIDWRAPKPVPRSELPMESVNAAFSRVKCERMAD